MTTTRKPGKPKAVWKYAQADFEMAKELIDSTNWDALLSGDVNVALANWQREFLKIMEQCIPRCTLSRRQNLPWLSKRITQSIRKRNCLFKEAKRTGNSAANQKYKKMRNRVTTLLQNAKRAYIRGLNPADKKKFWKAVKFLTEKNTTIPELSQDGITASNSAEKANMLNMFFGKCFNHSLPPLGFSDLDELDPAGGCPEEFLCMVEEVQWLLK